MPPFALAHAPSQQAHIATVMQVAVILPEPHLREHQEQMEAFLQIARHGLEALYQQVAGLGYVVLLTDARGVTVDFIGDLVFGPSLRKAGLYLGADWSEHHAGTCGVGTCISTGQALTVHLDDHFDATHIPLTCTAAPVFDTVGRLNAVLDISQLSSHQPKESQHLALQLVKVYAQHVENAAFLQRHRHDWVLRLSEAPQFLDVNPDYLLALDAAGRVIGHNRRAQLLFEPALRPRFAEPACPPDATGAPSLLIGQPLEALLELRFDELGQFVQGRAADQRVTRRAGSRQLLFLLAAPPPAAWVLRVLAEREVLPVGATRPEPVKLRVIAATHAPLEVLVREGRFRDDLYYRLNGAQVRLPPLRERRDLDVLIDRMLADATGALARTGSSRSAGPPETPPEVSTEARAALHAYAWPGNLRELRNALDYARTVCSHGVVRLADLPEALATAAVAGVETAGSLRLPRADPHAKLHAESQHPAPSAATALDSAGALRAALQAARWKVSALARQQGCSRMTLYRRMKQHGIRSPLADGDRGCSAEQPDRQPLVQRPGAPGGQRIVGELAAGFRHAVVAGTGKSPGVDELGDQAIGHQRWQ